MSVCKRCNASVATGLRFCGLCGTEVADPTSDTVAFVTYNDDPLLAQMRLVLGGEYEIERECGRGGMAAVFKAMDVSLRRPVALKAMLPGAAVGGAVAERLRREARRAAALDHPNIVPIYKVGEAGGIHYIVMKFIEGRPLDAIIEGQGALPIAVVVAVLRATASALAYAHESGTIHRDIKSSNILIDQEGRVYVSDFGLARAAEDSKVTPSGAVVGTPSFMSPEQCSGAPVGPQGDQYSLGIVGFHMLAGTAPFEASSVLAVVQHHYFTPPPDLNKIRDDVPEALASIIRRCVEKNPARRFINTSDLVTALETLPFQSEEQRTAKDILRRLARGYRVPIVQTGVLPPLPDARHTATAVRWASRLQPRVLLAIGLAVVMLISGGWIAVRTARTRSPALPSPATVIASPPIITDTARPARPLPASPTPTRPVQARSMGRVRLRTEPPDAVILIDGRQVGIGTVFDIEVPTGVRRLRIRAPGSVTFDTTFEVTAGNTTRLGLIALRNSP
ncbi:MAG TPA: serine/threonine-protein kinase [Gemmatimonadales bacterium]|nr:serine/threonine-protein kinase [Gemmatimonadales bacterium]